MDEQNYGLGNFLRRDTDTDAAPSLASEVDINRILTTLQQHARTPQGASSILAYMRRGAEPIGLGGMLPRPKLKLGTIDVSGAPVEVSFDGRAIAFTHMSPLDKDSSFGVGATKAIQGPSGIGAFYQRRF